MVRSHQQILSPSNKAGVGTSAHFQGDEAQRTDAQKDENKVTVRETQGTSSFTQTEVADDGSKTGLGVEEVLAAERRAAEDAIQRQDVPAGYREYLRRYFDGIEPGRKER